MKLESNDIALAKQNQIERTRHRGVHKTQTTVPDGIVAVTRLGGGVMSSWDYK